MGHHAHHHHRARPAPAGEAGHVTLTADADRGKLLIALGLILGFMAVEVVAGIVAQSLALLSDAAHMLTDAGALVLSLVAMRLAQRPARGAMTYGLARSEIIAAAVNGTTLLVLGLIITFEGVQRLIDPPATEGGLVLMVGTAGVVVNLAATLALSRANRQSLNVEGAYQHILTDLFAFVATAIAGAIILLTDFVRADGIASLLVAAIMLHAAYGLLRASGRIFLEAAPEGLNPDAVGRAMIAAAGVVEVHDLHVWEVTSGFPALSAHVTVREDADCHTARAEVAAMLHHRFGIDHTTLQVDHEHDRLLSIEPM